MNFSNNSPQERENTVVGSPNINLPNFANTSIESVKVHNYVYHQTISCLPKTGISLAKSNANANTG